MSDPDRELLEPARELRWRVPELALMLSDRAVAEARRAGDTELRLNAEALALFASNRLGHSVAVTGRAIAAVRDSEESAGTGTALELRVELACCARRAGSYDAAVRVLRPVLRSERVRPELRAHALIELAASLPAQRRAAESMAALDEAERLYTGEAELGPDNVRLLRARVYAARACHYRRHAELSAATGAAEAGLKLLERLGDATADSGEVRGLLVLEHVQTLLDTGRHSEAVGAAETFLAQPLRAASAVPAGWLRLALATRVRMPGGEYRSATGLLTEALSGAERHELVDLRAELNNTLSYLHDRADNLAEALRYVRAAYAADRTWRASVHAARIRLAEEFPARTAEAGLSAGAGPSVEVAPSVDAGRWGDAGLTATWGPGSGAEPDVRWQPAKPGSPPSTQESVPATDEEAAPRVMDSLTRPGRDPDRADVGPGADTGRAALEVSEVADPEPSRRRRAGGRRAAPGDGPGPADRPTTGRRHRAEGVAEPVAALSGPARAAGTLLDAREAHGERAAPVHAEAAHRTEDEAPETYAAPEGTAHRPAGPLRGGGSSPDRDVPGGEVDSRSWPGRHAGERRDRTFDDGADAAPLAGGPAGWPPADIPDQQPAYSGAPAPDVTTIMPVIPGLADEPGDQVMREEPYRRDTDQDGLDQELPGLEDPHQPDVADRAGPEAGSSGEGSLGEGTGGEDTELGDERPSRRATGRSLAEIRAALNARDDTVGGVADGLAPPRHESAHLESSPAESESAEGALTGSGTVEPGERRARHAGPRKLDEAPVTEFPSGREAAADFLARHRSLLEDLPAISVDAGTTRERSADAADDTTGADDHAGNDGADVTPPDDLTPDEPAEERTVLRESAPGAHEESADVGLADLLAEALVAYRSGQAPSEGRSTGSADPHARPRHAEARSLPDGVRSGAGEEHPVRSTEDGAGRAAPARHRHAAESTPDSSYAWTPPVY